MRTIALLLTRIALTVLGFLIVYRGALAVLKVLGE
jgi:hypothetical protein